MIPMNGQISQAIRITLKRKLNFAKLSLKYILKRQPNKMLHSTTLRAVSEL